MSVIVGHPVATPCSSVSQVIDTLLPAQNCVLIPAGTTVVVDVAPTANFRGVKWLITLAALDASLVRSFEVFGTHQNGASPSHNEYSGLGSIISYVTDVTISGGNLQLEITNNEAVDLVAMTTAIPIPITPTVLTMPTLGVVPIDNIHAYVPGSSSVVVDSVTTQFRSVKWLISVTDCTNTLRKVIEVYSSHRECVVVANNAYAMAGDYIDIVPSTSLLGEFMQLEIQNNELDFVTIDITRIPVTACYETNCDCTDVTIKPKNIIIAPTVTQTVDLVSQMGHRASKWLVAVTDLTTNDTEQYQVFAVHNGGVTAYTQYSLLGPVLSHTLIFDVVGLDFRFRVTNTGANSIQVDAVRLPIMV